MRWRRVNYLARPCIYWNLRMTQPKDNAWPKPYLLQLYARAVSDGCIRLNLHGDEEKFKSLKAAFYRIRRRKDAQSVALMAEEYYLCSISWEAERGTALIVYDQLPDGQDLPEIESVEHKHSMPMPRAPTPAPTPEIEPEFDPQAHIQQLLDNIKIEEEDGDGSTEL